MADEIPLLNYLNAHEHLPSPVAVGKRLLQLGQVIEQVVDEIAVLDEAAVVAKQKHDVAHARSLLNSFQKTETLRQAEALLACEDLKLAMEIAKLLLRSKKEQLDKLEEQVRIAQSVGATSRAEMATMNWTQP